MSDVEAVKNGGVEGLVKREVGRGPMQGMY